jgi:hypothetical protein
LEKEALLCGDRSKNIIDIVFMEQALHNEPKKLRSFLQAALKKTIDHKGRTYDAILLGYGLCSNGIAGLKAKVPIVVPRAHDCITLLIGSKDNFADYFNSHKGIYWYGPGWINTGTQPGKESLEITFEQYKKKYGEDNAKYLIETQNQWLKEYNWATYIDWGFENAESEKEMTKNSAKFFGWKYDEIKGDPSLLQKLLDGNWNPEEFLVVEPGQTIAEDLTSPGIITTKPDNDLTEN